MLHTLFHHNGIVEDLAWATDMAMVVLVAIIGWRLLSLDTTKEAILETYL
jgi:hypothetical protein